MYVRIFEGWIDLGLHKVGRLPVVGQQLICSTCPYAILEGYEQTREVVAQFPRAKVRHSRQFVNYLRRMGFGTRENPVGLLVSGVAHKRNNDLSHLPEDDVVEALDSEESPMPVRFTGYYD